MKTKEVVTETAKNILGGELTKEKIADMNSREKTTTWFKAVLNKDEKTVKALSEGKRAVLLSLKTVNCWETLMKNIKTISSQVYTAMCLKVQSIVDDTLMVSNSTTSALSSLTI